MTETWTPEHPAFGRIAVVSEGTQLTKTDTAVVRTHVSDDTYYDIFWGAGSQNREVLGAVTIEGKEVYRVARDDTHRLHYRIHRLDGAAVPSLLQGMYTSTQKAAEAALAYHV